MNKSLKFLFVLALIAAMFSSCKKKTTDLSILTGHKWVLSTARETFSDSTVSHNLMSVDTICQNTSYTEFHDYNTNNPLRFEYTYATTNCSGQYVMPDLGVQSWDIDPDNTALYVGGNTTNGQGGTWYTLQSLTSSSMVLTQVYQSQIGNTGFPGFTPIYHTVTDTWTFSVK